MISASFNRYAQDQIMVYRVMLDFVPTIKAVAQSFDGKMINKRFTDALEAASPITHIGAPYYIEKDTACFKADFDRGELRVKLYYWEGCGIDNDRRLSNTIFVFFPIYGERLDAAAFCAKLDESVQTIQGNIARLEDEQAHLPEVLDKIREAAQILASVEKYRWAVTQTKEDELSFARELAKVYLPSKF